MGGSANVTSSTTAPSYGGTSTGGKGMQTPAPSAYTPAQPTGYYPPYGGSTSIGGKGMQTSPYGYSPFGGEVAAPMMNYQPAINYGGYNLQPVSMFNPSINALNDYGMLNAGYGYGPQGAIPNPIFNTDPNATPTGGFGRPNTSDGTNDGSVSAPAGRLSDGSGTADQQMMDYGQGISLRGQGGLGGITPPTQDQTATAPQQYTDMGGDFSQNWLNQQQQLSNQTPQGPINLNSGAAMNKGGSVDDHMHKTLDMSRHAIKNLDLRKLRRFE